MAIKMHNRKLSSYDQDVCKTMIVCLCHWKLACASHLASDTTTQYTCSRLLVGKYRGQDTKLSDFSWIPRGVVWLLGWFFHFRQTAIAMGLTLRPASSLARGASTRAPALSFRVERSVEHRQMAQHSQMFPTKGLHVLEEQEQTLTASTLVPKRVATVSTDRVRGSCFCTGTMSKAQTALTASWGEGWGH